MHTTYTNYLQQQLQYTSTCFGAYFVGEISTEFLLDFCCYPSGISNFIHEHDIILVRLINVWGVFPGYLNEEQASSEDTRVLAATKDIIQNRQDLLEVWWLQSWIRQILPGYNPFKMSPPWVDEFNHFVGVCPCTKGADVKFKHRWNILQECHRMWADLHVVPLQCVPSRIELEVVHVLINARMQLYKTIETRLTLKGLRWIWVIWPTNHFVASKY